MNLMKFITTANTIKQKVIRLWYRKKSIWYARSNSVIGFRQFSLFIMSLRVKENTMNIWVSRITLIMRYLGKIFNIHYNRLENGRLITITAVDINCITKPIMIDTNYRSGIENAITKRNFLKIIMKPK